MARAKGNSGGKRQAKLTKPKTKPPASSHAELVEKAILAFGQKVETKNVTVGDFIRLLQLQKEINGDDPKEIKVTWVDTAGTESSEK